MALYPLLLEPIYKERVWGGRALERMGRVLPGGPGTGIGESWELADLDATSPSGGGGAGAYSRIRNGPLRERTLRQVVHDFGELVTGSVKPGASGAFPLLLKYLDARENLSVQVHPSPAYVALHPDAHLKSEAWYIVEAAPDAVIYKGVRSGTTPEAFERAIADGSVVDLLIPVPARAGDCHYLPSGTCHALGAGVLVAEVQTPSDTTFRVYDWGRTDRELHIAQALQCIDFHPVDASAFEPGTQLEASGQRGIQLVTCEHFGIRRWAVAEGGELRRPGDALEVLMVVRGRGAIRWGSAGHERSLNAGDTVLLPAALGAAAVLAHSDTEILEVTLAPS
jgi:mannose-6-phosphate isomerase